MKGLLAKQNIKCMQLKLSDLGLVASIRNEHPKLCNIQLQLQVQVHFMCNGLAW